MTNIYGIILHGGAGRYRLFTKEFVEKRKRELRRAALYAFEELKTGSALDAVEAAIKYMEDSGLFNAGKGSSLTITKEIEMDAGIMDGKTLKCGAVACVKNIRNPIKLARLVLEKTDHIFLAGPGAEKVAEILGMKIEPIEITPEKIRKFERVFKLWLEGKWGTHLFRLKTLYKDFIEGTVGAVAIDKDRNIAAATSTGGYSLKLPGRVGDTPLVGCGFYADNSAGGASATGVGEYLTLIFACKTACDFMRQGVSAMKAAEATIDILTRRFGPHTGGIITVDPMGRIGFAYNTEGMGKSIMTSYMGEPAVAVFPEEDHIILKSIKK